MRSAIVPAQITTVEDKVAGNLSMAQLLLLCSPLFVGSVIYVVFPPFFGGAIYKLILVGLAAAVFWILAIRLKGRILLEWAVTIGRYNLRPRHYVFDKNDEYLRRQQSLDQDLSADVQGTNAERPQFMRRVLSTSDLVMLDGIIANPESNLRFATDRKGALGVRINEVR